MLRIFLATGPDAIADPRKQRQRCGFFASENAASSSTDALRAASDELAAIVDGIVNDIIRERVVTQVQQQVQHSQQQQQLELDPDSTRVEVRCQDLLLWRRQAHALGRSWEHLQKIHRLIELARWMPKPGSRPPDSATKPCMNL